MSEIRMTVSGFLRKSMLKEYRTTLQETGLFSAIDMKPARLSPEQAKAAGWTDRDMADFL